LAASCVCLSCGSSPTQPAPPVVTGTSAVLTVTSLSPASPMSGSTPQTLTIGGTNFAVGLGVSLRLADGSTSVVPASQVQAVTASSFQVTVTLTVAGAYGLTATNPSGSSSGVFGFTVQSGPLVAPDPTILSIAPSTILQNSPLQALVLSGLNFVSPLAVTAIAPDGAQLTVDGSVIVNVTTTSCQISMVLTQVGTYRFSVTTPAGASSNGVTVNVLSTNTTFTLSGTVEDLNHLPLVGASVAIVSGPWQNHGTTTDVAGNYQISGVSGTMTVMAGRSGYVSSEASLRLTSDQQLNFSLVPELPAMSEFFGLNWLQLPLTAGAGLVTRRADVPR
jgi:hypothetical protein